MTSADQSKYSMAVMMEELGAGARAAAQSLARSSGERRNGALLAAAEAVRDNRKTIAAANATDRESARQKQLASSMLDRLLLDDGRIEAMATAIETVAAMQDPVGRTLAEWQRPNGLTIQRISVPLGVIGIIYESRPNVTADAGALCLKAGNAAILRGGSESFESSQAIYRCMREGLRSAGLDENAVQMIPTTDRAAVGYLLSSMSQFIDVVVPRGGKSLIQRVQEEARVPVIGHLEGICHIYVHASAEPEMAVAVAVNAKMRRTGICGAAETLLVDSACADELVPQIAAALLAAGCEIRGDAHVQRLVSEAGSANDADWSTEYLDAVISVRVVGSIDEAIDHIAHYGSGHTDSIIAGDNAAAEQFLGSVDSAIVLHNASTQFADGGEFGMGSEIGIATGRIHARGPVGADQLTSYKYVVRGSGQVRP